MNYDKVITTLNESIMDLDIINIVDNPDNCNLTRLIQKAYNIHTEQKTMTYMILIQSKQELLIMEQHFMKYLYHNYRISFDPWIKFKGHVIVPAKEFTDKVELEVIEDIYNNKMV